MANKFRIQDGIISQGEGIFEGVKTPSVSYGSDIDLNITGVEFVGYIDDGFGGSPGSTLHVTSITSGTITDGMTIYGAGLPVEGWTLTFGTVMAPQGSGGTGNYYLSGANLLISSQTFNGPPSKSWSFQSDGKLALPAGGDIVDSTGTSVLGGGGSGTQGIQGLQGADGVQGITGADGLQGLPGMDGAPGTPGIDGAPGSPGMDGSPGADGLQGIEGAQGTQGLQGLIGPVAGSDTQVIFNDASTAGASSNLTFNKSTNLLTVTGNVSVTGTDSNVIRRAYGLVAADTYVTLDDLKARVTSSTSQLSLMLTTGTWQGTGWTETFQGGGTPSVNNWVNLPLETGFDNASGAMPNQGNGCRCVISDQTPNAKVYQITVVRSGTSSAMWNICIERLV